MSNERVAQFQRQRTTCRGAGVPRGSLLRCLSLVTALGAAGLALAGPESNIPDEKFFVAEGAVYSTLRTDDGIYLGGDFHAVGPNTGGGVFFNYVATPNKKTIPNLEFPRVNGKIYAAVPDSNGGWYIGGDFTAIASDLGWISASNLAYVTASKEVKVGWIPLDEKGEPTIRFSSPVRALALDGDRLYAGGEFTVSDTNDPTTAPQFTVSLYAEHAVDSSTPPKPKRGLTTWGPGVTVPVYAIAPTSDGIYLGGGPINPSSNPGLLRLVNKLSGLLIDESVVPNQKVLALEVAGDTLYVGGAFTAVTASGQGFQRGKGCAVAMSSRALLPWHPGADASINSIRYLADAGSGSAAVFIGGEFTYVAENATTYSPRKYLSKVDPFSGYYGGLAQPPSPEAAVYSLANYGSSLYVGSAIKRTGILSTDPPGELRALRELDLPSNAYTTWDPGIRDTVRALALSAGAGLYVGGEFASANSIKQSNLAKLNPTTGELATGCPPSLDRPVYALARDPEGQAGGKLYVGGAFDKVDPAGQAIVRKRAAAFSLSTGQLEAWNPNPTSTSNPADGAVVRAIALVPDGIYLGGEFDQVNGTTSWSNLALFNSSGGLVSAKSQSAANTRVHCLAVSGNTMYVGGESTSAQPDENAMAINVAPSASLHPLLQWFPRPNGTVRAMLPADGGVYLGGNFNAVGSGVTRKFLAHVNTTDGTVTVPTCGNQTCPSLDGQVYALAACDGRVYVGGSFTKVENVALLSSDTSSEVGNKDADTGMRKNLAGLERVGENYNLLAWTPESRGTVHALRCTKPAGVIGKSHIVDAGIGYIPSAAAASAPVRGFAAWLPASDGIERRHTFKNGLAGLWTGGLQRMNFNQYSDQYSLIWHRPEANRQSIEFLIKKPVETDSDTAHLMETQAIEVFGQIDHTPGSMLKVTSEVYSENYINLPQSSSNAHGLPTLGFYGGAASFVDSHYPVYQFTPPTNAVPAAKMAELNASLNTIRPPELSTGNTRKYTAYYLSAGAVGTLPYAGTWNPGIFLRYGVECGTGKSPLGIYGKHGVKNFTVEKVNIPELSATNLIKAYTADDLANDVGGETYHHHNGHVMYADAGGAERLVFHREIPKTSTDPDPVKYDYTYNLNYLLPPHTAGDIVIDASHVGKVLAVRARIRNLETELSERGDRCPEIWIRPKLMHHDHMTWGYLNFFQIGAPGSGLERRKDVAAQVLPALRDLTDLTQNEKEYTFFFEVPWQNAGELPSEAWLRTLKFEVHMHNDEGHPKAPTESDISKYEGDRFSLEKLDVYLIDPALSFTPYKRNKSVVTNDEVCDALPIGCDGLVTGQLLANSLSSGNSPSCGADRPDVWYYTDVAKSGTKVQAAFSYTGSYGGSVSLWTGSNCSTLLEQTCASTQGTVPAVATFITTAANQRVWIRLECENANVQSTLELRMTDDYLGACTLQCGDTVEKNFFAYATSSTSPSAPPYAGMKDVWYAVDIAPDDGTAGYDPGLSIKFIDNGSGSAFVQLWRVDPGTGQLGHIGTSVARLTPDNRIVLQSGAEDGVKYYIRIGSEHVLDAQMLEVSCFNKLQTWPTP